MREGEVDKVKGSFLESRGLPSFLGGGRQRVRPLVTPHQSCGGEAYG